MANQTTILKLELNNVKTTPCWGGTTTTAEYSLETICNNIKNNYIVVGEIRGIATNDLYFNMISCEALTNNEETLIESAIEDLLNW
jgi:hypothetical protein